MPVPTSHATRRSTSRTTPRALAPSAMRTPISARRDVTPYDVTPYSPTAASSSPSTPKKPASVATIRSRVSDAVDLLLERAERQDGGRVLLFDCRPHALRERLAVGRRATRIATVAPASAPSLREGQIDRRLHRRAQRLDRPRLRRRPRPGTGIAPPPGRAGTCADRRRAGQEPARERSIDDRHHRRPAASRARNRARRSSCKPSVSNHPGVTAFTHDIRSRRASGESGGTAIIVFQPPRATGVVNDTAAADTPGRPRRRRESLEQREPSPSPRTGLRSTLAVDQQDAAAVEAASRVCSATNVRVKRPAATTSASDSATCRTTLACRSRARRSSRAASPCSFSASFGAGGRRAGRRDAEQQRRREPTAVVKPSTRQSSARSRSTVAATVVNWRTSSAAAPPRQRDAERRARGRKHHALGEQLARDPQPRRAERQPQRQLVAARRRARDQQVRDVGARDQQDEPHDAQDGGQRLLVARAPAASARRAPASA